MKKNLSSTLSRRAFCFVCVAGALGGGASALVAGENASLGAQPLKSAAELADLLRSKLGKPFEIPARTGLDVLGAEQKNPRAVIFKADSDWNDPASIRWYWSAAEAPEIAPEHRRWFNTVCECKPAYGDRCVLTQNNMKKMRNRELKQVCLVKMKLLLNQLSFIVILLLEQTNIWHLKLFL